MTRAQFSGPVWYGIPDDFPQTQLEEQYRRFLVLLSDCPEKRLLAGGFTAAAYRYRAMVDYEKDYLDSFRPNDLDNREANYRQDRALFGFLVNGLSSIEGFCFGLQAVMAWVDHEPLDEHAQRNVSPQRVGEELRRRLPDHVLTNELAELLSSDDYTEWRELRNMLAHRTAAFRDYALVVGGGSSVKWRVGQQQFVLDENITVRRRRFLAGRFQALSAALTAFNPKVSPPS